MLPQLKIVALDIQDALLLLSQTVERFVRVGLPQLARVESRLILHHRALHHMAARRFRKDGLTGRIHEADAARLPVHPHFQLRRDENQVSVGCGQAPFRGRGIRQHGGRASREENGALCERHAHDVL